MHVRARECVFTPGVAGMICTAGDTKNSQNAREEGKGGTLWPRPLMAGHASVIGWSLEVRVQSGSCHSSEERSKVDVHRSSPVLPSPGGVLPDHAVAPESRVNFSKDFLTCRHFLNNIMRLVFRYFTVS